MEVKKLKKTTIPSFTFKGQGHLEVKVDMS